MKELLEYQPRKPGARRSALRGARISACVLLPVTFSCWIYYDAHVFGVDLMFVLGLPLMMAGIMDGSVVFGMLPWIGSALARASFFTPGPVWNRLLHAAGTLPILDSGCR